MQHPSRSQTPIRRWHRPALVIGVIAAALATSVVAVSGAEATSASTSRQPLSFTVVPVVVTTPDLKFPQPGDVEAAVFNNLQHGHQIGSDRSSLALTLSV
jgi:hypothetical protein